MKITITQNNINNINELFRICKKSLGTTKPLVTAPYKKPCEIRNEKRKNKRLAAIFNKTDKKKRKI